MATAAPQSAPPKSVPADEFIPSGWVSFAAIMLFIGGFFDAIWGLAAVLNDKVVTVGGQGVTIADFTTWGWVHMIVGAVMILAGGGLLAGKGWARVTAIIFATLSVIAQVGAFSAFPLWSLTVVALGVVIIYQLTANWTPARD